MRHAVQGMKHSHQSQGDILIEETLAPVDRAARTRYQKKSREHRWKLNFQEDWVENLDGPAHLIR